jgi:hypothetical protein
MNFAIAILLLIVGIIHLLPLSGVLGATRLKALYALPFDEPNLVILMRHRAVLFGLLGAFFVYAAFQPTVQPIAFVAGLVSVLSFIGIALQVGGYNRAVRIVIVADLVALVCLIAAILIYFLQKP